MSSPSVAIDHPWVNSSRAPLYEVTFPSSATQDELLAYFLAVESWSRGVVNRVIWLMDTSNVREMSAAQRAAFAGFLRRMHSFDQRHTHATAVVLTNPFVRGLVTAVFWLHHPPYFLHVCSTIEEARTWASARARELEHSHKA